MSVSPWVKAAWSDILALCLVDPGPRSPRHRPRSSFNGSGSDISRQSSSSTVPTVEELLAGDEYFGVHPYDLDHTCGGGAGGNDSPVGGVESAESAGSAGSAAVSAVEAYTVLIGGLAAGTDTDDLHDFFSLFGVVLNAGLTGGEEAGVDTRPLVRLNLSATCGIGAAFRGCLGVCLGGVREYYGVSRVLRQNGSS
jgi:hypothetical protein